MTREEAEACTILRVVVGSTVHGLQLEGTDDMDHMGICVEGLSEAVTLSEPFEQFIFRSAAEREHSHDAPSQPGDLDLTIFSLRKWLRLALKGNPTVILPLFVPVEFAQIDGRTRLSGHVLVMNALGSQLRDLAPSIISKRAGVSFLGYMQAQKQRLMGTRGQMRVNRPELTAKHGYDTKYAGHVVRLALQGIELMNTGKLVLPIRDPARSLIMRVRTGETTLNEALDLIAEAEDDLKAAIVGSTLPEQPDREACQVWMQAVYLNTWRATQASLDMVAGFNQRMNDVHGETH